MTDSGMGAVMETLLDAVRRAVVHVDDVPSGTSASDPDALVKTRALRDRWALAAWQEIRHASEARSRAADVDHLAMSVAEYTDAVSTATRWADSIFVLAGVRASDDGVSDALRRAMTAGYALLVARHGPHAAGVIYDETRTAVLEGRRAPRADG